MRHHSFLFALLLAIAPLQLRAAPGDPVHETCPSAEDVGDNVECYPVTFTSKTKIHPDGIPIIGYLFVPKDRVPGEPLPAIVFAHGSGSMYSDGNHNKGLNSKHRQWVRQYTNDLGIVGLHVSSFHSRYLLPDTEGDQRILDIEMIPDGGVGGDDYRATSYLGYAEDEDGNPLPYEYLAFDPAPEDSSEKWKDSDNGGAGVSEVMERAYDMDAAWDFLAGIRKGRSIENTLNDDEEAPTRGTPMTGIGYIGEIVNGGLVVDHERIFLYGTSHGGQTAMAAAHALRALGDANPMNADLPEGFDRHRFAAFFDYYGGCGLFGAYGGADFNASDPEDNSMWRPYAPFLMFHGENDPIWVDNNDSRLATTRQDWLENSECYNRIAAAKSDSAFADSGVLLEAILYKGAEHSFDGLKRDDFNNDEDPNFAGWLAKIHANYRVSIPFMQAIGRIVSADRNEAQLPVLADFAFTPDHLQFTTFPFDPWIPPVAFNEDRSPSTWIVSVPDLANTDINLYDFLTDPLQRYPFTCEVIASQVAQLDDCVLKFRASGFVTDSHHRYLVSTPKGQTIISAYLRANSALGNGQLEFAQQPIHLPPPGHRFQVADNGTFRFDGRSFSTVPDWYWSEHRNHALRIGANSPTTDYPPDNGFIEGETPLAEEAEELRVEVNIQAYFDYSLLPTSLGFLEVQCCNFDELGSGGFTSTPLLPNTDFVSRFVPMTPVSDVNPPPPGQFPGDGDGDGEGDGGDGGDGDSGDGDSGDGDSGDGDPGDGDPGDDDSGSNDTGDNDPDGNSGNSSGGGALFWLLPFALLFRRR